MHNNKQLPLVSAIRTLKDVPPYLRTTPIGILFATHNLKETINHYHAPSLIIGTCMDFRINLQVPPSFAFIIRSAGTHMQDHLFPIAFALSANAIPAIAIIGHVDCRMQNLLNNENQFVEATRKNFGWPASKSANLFEKQAPHFTIGSNVISFIVHQVEVLRQEFPSILSVPLLYNENDHKLYLINETLFQKELA